VRRVLQAEPFVARLREAVASSREAVPLLLLRLPEFAEIAWRDGRRAAQRIEKTTVRAFAIAARRVIRDGDLLAHEGGSDWFAVAMISQRREGRSFGAVDARAALERIASTMSVETGRRMECGWWPVENEAEVDDFSAMRQRALDRGARERERFEFLATVGHELRTPLTSIRGYIETLLESELDAETSRRFLETARREALRLARLVDGMLEFSLLDLNATAARGSTDVRAAVHAAIDALLPIAREAGVTLRAKARGQAYASIDADSCMHVLVNVIENAIKYSGRGGVVTIDVLRDRSWISVIVDDNGRGVALADREKIFAYRDRGSASREVSGKGVGLAIVRTIVERAGGRVSVADSPTGGARFTATLPSAFVLRSSSASPNESLSRHS
jgi:signal transduction histidine kinase